MSITRNRELSQFGSFLYIDDTTQSIAITEGSSGFVGIGSTIPTAKLDVFGSVNVSGSISASSFSGSISNATNSVYAETSGISTVSSGLSTVSSVKTSGIITASAFYVNDVLLINPEFSTWNYTAAAGIGNTIYRLGNVGIGTSIGVTERLVVSGNVSASGNVSGSRFISTITSGTSPLQVLSSTLVTNLNADFLRGKVPPSGDIVGSTDTQTLTNKTLTLPTVGSGGITFNGSSGSTNLRASTAASGTLTLPAETGTLISTASVGVVTSANILNNTIVNEDINASAGIAISKLAASTISGVSLGNNLGSLTFGSYLSGTTASYNGSSAVTVSVAATSINTADTLVARDASGDFTAGTITGTIVNATSDVNLKQNIKPIENGLETLKQMEGVEYEWKANSQKSIGVIAQQIEQILPELVTEVDGNKTVNYNGLIGILIEAVKELSEEVEELKKKNI
jgi:hypothetical protein